MCGLIGYLGGSSLLARDENEQIVRKMGNAIEKRGPDSFGYWSDLTSGIVLGHRRLAIVDLSPAGAQPMQSPNEQFCMAFNGEIYNHLELRKELEKEGHAQIWRGHSDTETLLAGFMAWGVEATIHRCVGMFAIALWDKLAHTLTLIRDRLGEKPLYYGWQGVGDQAVFLFGSELKALKLHPAFASNIDRNSLCSLLRYSYIGGSHSIYQNINKLEAGNILTVSLKQRTPFIRQYWSLPEVAKVGYRNQFCGSPEEAVDALEKLLMNAIRQQMVADVPLGAFLSGGIDSSTIVSLMQAQSVKPVKTFTIGFNDEGYNEALHAKAVAKHLGTEHTELYVSPQKALDVIPQLPTMYCEPFSDSSQIPTFLVSQLARQKVTVSLSGDAGDELFCGYNRYVMTQNLWGKIAKTPASIRQIASHGLKSFSPNTWNKILGPVQKFAPARFQLANIGDKLHKGAGVLAAKNLDQLYFGLVSHWNDPGSVVLNANEYSNVLNVASAPGSVFDGLGNIERMMALDSTSYLPDDILVKVDRAGMAVSLEGRVPFLDHRVVEFAWHLPQSLKLRDGQSKWILRQVLYRHVPKALIERPKMGFGVPIGNWLRGPLRDWAENLLDESRLKQEGYFSPQPIRQKWQEHLSGKRDWQYHLWDVLMFQAWLEVNR